MRIKLLIAMAFASAFPGILSAQALLRGKTSEAVIRSRVLSSVKPSFPEDALRNRKVGVCVVSVSIDASGAVYEAQVLEAPAPSMSNAALAAVRQWRFKPFNSKGGKPVLISSKLTFYFEINHGTGLVLDPADTGYVGVLQSRNASVVSKH